MSTVACPEPLTQSTAATKSRSVAAACREVRQSWSQEERARRKQVAEMKQIGLLLNTIDMTTFLKAVSTG